MTPYSIKRARIRGLQVGGAIVLLIGCAAAWSSRPPVPVAAETAADIHSSLNVSAPSAREIADQVRRSTVQISAASASGHTVSEGTGFFISRDGLIATNLHVIRDASSLEISNLSGLQFDDVGLVAVDADHDIALLKVGVSNAQPLVMSSATDLAVGDPVYVMGNPLGQTGTFSNGLLSAYRDVEGSPLLQITAPISHGSSGGPVVNAGGQVVGIATAVLDGGQNLNYAVPVRFARSLLENAGPPQPFSARLLPPSPRARRAVPSTIPSRRRSRRSDGRDAITLQFATSDSVMRAMGFVPITGVARQSLREGRQATHQVSAVGGMKYAIAGYCDEDCADLDLAIRDAAGLVLDADTQSDAGPTVSFTAKTSGAYQVTVSMRSCAVAPCEYGVRLYRSVTTGSPARRPE